MLYYQLLVTVLHLIIEFYPYFLRYKYLTVTYTYPLPDWIKNHSITFDQRFVISGAVIASWELVQKFNKLIRQTSTAADSISRLQRATWIQL